jgi:hypothetical protein
MKRINLVGQKFNRLLILEQTGKYCTCQCDCGNITTKTTGNVVNEHTKSCGCLQEETRRVHGITNYKPDKVGSFNSLYGGYLRRSAKKELEFTLTKQDFLDITSKPCFYCGKLPSMSASWQKSNGVYIYNGIDRVDNSKGYILENCVPCCKDCNYSKGTKTVNEFYEHIRRVYSYKELYLDE